MWLYNNKVIETLDDFPTSIYGFIYITTHIPSGMSYIGKKVLFHNIKRKLTRKELAEHQGAGRKPTHQIVQKESDWKTYYGSAKPILEMLKEGKHSEFKREILELVYSKKLLTYYECKYLFKYGVLESPEGWINDNIQGKFYRKDFVS